MRVIVTGAAGFIGSHLTDRLLEQGPDVMGVDNFDLFYAESRKRANLSTALGRRRFRLVEMDIRDGEGIARPFWEVQPDAVARLAARVAGSDPESTTRRPTRTSTSRARPICFARPRGSIPSHASYMHPARASTATGPMPRSARPSPTSAGPGTI